MRGWTSEPQPGCTPRLVVKAARYAALSTVLWRALRSGTMSPSCTRTLTTTSSPTFLRCESTPGNVEPPISEVAETVSLAEATGGRDDWRHGPSGHRQFRRPLVQPGDRRCADRRDRRGLWPGVGAGCH